MISRKIWVAGKLQNFHTMSNISFLFQELSNLLKMFMSKHEIITVAIAVEKVITFINAEVTVIPKSRPWFWMSSVTKILTILDMKLQIHTSRKKSVKEGYAMRWRENVESIWACLQLHLDQGKCLNKSDLTQKF